MIILAPVIVIALGLVAAVTLLLGRGLVATIRESGHPRLVVGGLVALAAAVVVLTWLGVDLPREGG